MTNLNSKNSLTRTNQSVSTSYWSRGFSLTELMSVVAIIGLLAAIAIPKFDRFQRRAKQAEVRSNLSLIYTMEKAFFVEHETYYDDIDFIGFSPQGTIRYRYGFNWAGGFFPPPPSLKAGVVAQYINTGTVFGGSAFCAQGGHTCVESTEYIFATLNPSPGTSVYLADEFLAGGASDLSGDCASAPAQDNANSGCDKWRIDHLKSFTQLYDGVYH